MHLDHIFWKSKLTCLHWRLRRQSAHWSWNLRDRLPSLRDQQCGDDVTFIEVRLWLNRCSVRRYWRCAGYLNILPEPWKSQDEREKSWSLCGLIRYLEPHYPKFQAQTLLFARRCTVSRHNVLISVHISLGAGQLANGTRGHASGWFGYSNDKPASLNGATRRASAPKKKHPLPECHGPEWCYIYAY